MLAFAGIGGAATRCGDADGDGVVTITDAVRVLRVAADLEPACATDACDVDGDDAVTVTDGVLVLRHAAGLSMDPACALGTVAGRLLVPPADTTPMAEHEPNDGPATADVAGWLRPGQTRFFRGTVGDDDPFDGWTLVTSEGVELNLALTFPSASGIDLDLLVDDRRGGAVTCESTRRGREHCRVSVATAAPAPLDVVVVAAADTQPASYRLAVRARAANGSAGITAGRGAGAPIDVEPAVWRGEAAEIAAGELVVELEPPHPSRNARSPAARIVAAARTAGVPDLLHPVIVAPDGTMLVELPEVHMAAVARSGTAVTALAAKRARAAARARTLAAAAALASDPDVRLVEPNRMAHAARVPRDPLFPRQWHFDAIGLPRAWDVTIGRAATVVAVVDTGIRSDHPDFAGRLVPGFDFISNPARANDGDGLDPDPFDPGDRPSDESGGSYHGTHVAGTIAAATDDTIGVAGVTWRTAIMPLRVLGVGGGTLFDVAQAVRFAAGLPNVSGTVPPVTARVVNLSLTTSGDDPVLRSAIDDAAAAGALVVAAAGNTGHDGFLAPAAYPNVLAVAATDRLGAAARYSSFGAAVDLAAPGGDTRRDRDADGFVDGILSTLLPGRQDYAFFQGTSMASAHVSGVAALLLGIPGGASAARLRDVLLSTAEDRGAPGRDDRYGAGIVDAARAVRVLAGLASPTEPVLELAAPTVRITADESVLRVPLRNVGGGTLAASVAHVATDDSGAWLGARTEKGALRVEIDRDALLPGTHPGRVDVRSNGGDRMLTVLADVDAAPGDIGPVLVLLRDATTRAIAAMTTTTVAEGYRYRFTDVAPGRYEILATTDRDGDGAICDVGESCGAYPERNAPDVVVIGPGGIGRARDFALQLVVSASENLP